MCISSFDRPRCIYSEKHLHGVLVDAALIAWFYPFQYFIIMPTTSEKTVFILKSLVVVMLSFCCCRLCFFFPTSCLYVLGVRIHFINVQTCAPFYCIYHMSTSIRITIHSISFYFTNVENERTTILYHNAATHTHTHTYLPFYTICTISIQSTI